MTLHHPQGRVSDSSQQILDTAAALFRRRGYAETSLRDIARAAGILPGSLHYRFAAKHDLLLALMERAVTRTTTAIRVAIGDTGDPAERLRTAMATYLELLLSGDDSLYVLLYDWRSLDGTEAHKVELLHQRLHALFDGLFYEAAGAGRIASHIDLLELRQLWLGAMNWTVQWHNPDDHGSATDVAERFWRILTPGTFASSPPTHVLGDTR